MDIRQLRYFTVIAEEKNISQAARKLHMSQPPLSQQLKLMEEELGIRLVHREGKRLRLTEAGVKLYHHAVQVTKLMEEGMEEVKEVGEGLKGSLKIGVNTLSEMSLSRLLFAFKEKYPAVTYEIHQNESGQLFQLLRERAIDLAVIRFPVQSEEFGHFMLKREPFYFVSREAWNGPVTLEKIAGETLLLPSTKGQGLYDYILQSFAQRGYEPNIVCASSDLTLLAGLVQQGFGATLVPESAMHIFSEAKVHSYLVEDEDLTTQYGVAWMKKYYLSKVATRFLEMYKEISRNPLGS
ncbi:LysR family transcriptional regulator [Sutcliffiella horikoshii]|uniref:LysR family transcriptional regulator n=1 Tax=Sutcliffiella horikoshii TaxID=79883 RepID=A0A1Y0CI91_9BACI|nr:LysR family transcriptional regulator [Sutcliffiella horikoshii]ART75000.1 LysR family transcriptional regulator [Sutcliffiella horikoshii]TYS58412.1 LysR family transcriptional regulator [Sutcliffiella horikoshii]